MTTEGLSSTPYTPPRSEPIPINNARVNLPTPTLTRSYRPITHAETKEVGKVHQAFSRYGSHLNSSAPKETISFGRTPNYKSPEPRSRRKRTPSLLTRLTEADLPLTLAVPDNLKST